MDDRKTPPLLCDVCEKFAVSIISDGMLHSYLCRKHAGTMMAMYKRAGRIEGLLKIQHDWFRKNRRRQYDGRKYGTAKMDSAWE